MTAQTLTLTGAARYCGMSRPTFRRLCAEGRGPEPWGRPGRYPKWSVHTLDAWLAAPLPDKEDAA